MKSLQTHHFWRFPVSRLINSPAVCCKIVCQQAQVQKGGPPQSSSQPLASTTPTTALATGHQALPVGAVNDAGSCARDGDGAAATSDSAAAEGLWKRFSEVGTVANCEPNNQLGSFYQVKPHIMSCGYRESPGSRQCQNISCW